MDSNRKITKKFTTKLNIKFINGQYFHGKTGVKYYSLLAVNIFFALDFRHLYLDIYPGQICQLAVNDDILKCHCVWGGFLLSAGEE